MSDTTPEAAEVQRRLLRAMSPSRKLAMVSDMSEATRKLTQQGIRRRHPEYDEQAARWALCRLLYGDDLFRKAWPDAPLLDP